MKFLHLSDLHIGKRVNEFSMIEDQEFILTKVINLVDEGQIEGVWIAGDIYDKSIPSAEAVQLFDSFLTMLAKRNIPIFIISGNHDSAERIAFGAKLLSNSQVYVSPVYDGRIEPAILQDEFGEIAIYLLPFLKPAIVRHCFPEEKVESYHDAVRVAIQKIEIDKNRRNVLLAHQFVTGASRCESEDISVGGVDNVEVSVFDDFDYVALGHIHGPQTIGRETVRYCGTLLKYSFSEVNHKKGGLVVAMNQKGNVAMEMHPLKPKRDLCEIRGTYMEVTSLAFYKDKNTDDYFHITLTDEEDILDAIGKLRTIYPNIMKLDYDNKRTREGQTVSTDEQMEEKAPIQLLEEFFTLQNNQPMDQEQVMLATKYMEEIWGDRV